MRWKTSTLMIGCLTLVLFAPAPIAGQGKSSTKAVPVTVSFRGEPADAITGGPVDGAIYLYPGSLSVRATAPLIRFTFDELRQGSVPTPNCWVSPLEKNGCTSSMTMPAGLSDNAAVSIHTYWEFRYVPDGDTVDEPEEWQPVTDTRGDPVFLNLLELEPLQRTYVQMVFRLTLPTSNDYYDVNFNRAWNATVGWNGGIFVVEAGPANHDGKVDTWHFRPVGQTDPGPPYLGWSEANLRMYESPDWKWDPPGGCTFGNFYMPFEMTVTRK